MTRGEYSAILIYCISEGEIKIANRANESQIGFVCLMCDVGEEKKVLEAMKKVDGVVDVRGVYGTYDVVVKVVAEDLDGLRKIVQNKIRRIPNIRSTLTFPVIES